LQLYIQPLTLVPTGQSATGNWKKLYHVSLKNSKLTGAMEGQTNTSRQALGDGRTLALSTRALPNSDPALTTNHKDKKPVLAFRRHGSR